MLLILVCHSVQDLDSLALVWLLHHHRLETPLERRVLLDILAVLCDRRGADQLDLASRQGRFEDVGRIDRPLRAAGADQRVDLI